MKMIGQMRNKTIFDLERELGLRPISLILLDNLGMTFSMESLNSGSLMYYLRDQYYGTNWLARWWCQRIRPKVASRKHKRIEHLYETAMTIYRRDFLNAVMEKEKESNEKRSLDDHLQ